MTYPTTGKSDTQVIYFILFKKQEQEQFSLKQNHMLDTNSLSSCYFLSWGVKISVYMNKLTVLN